jgi:cysteine desulfurase
MHLSDYIYLDHNATTILNPVVKKAMAEMGDEPLNASSIHAFGREAKKILEVARSNIAKAVGVDEKYEVVFTATGTEANNIALKGFKNFEVITTTIEHPSVLQVVGQGLIPVDKNGIVDLVALEEILKTGKKYLVSVIFANNEVGVIQPIKEIIDLVHKYNGIIHSDATQAFGKISLDISELDLDLITISAHKMGGPQGAAALVFKKNLPVHALMQGGGQEFRIRPGTQNLNAIHAFGVAASLINLNDYAKLAELRDYLESEIMQVCQDIAFFSKDVARLPNTSSFTMPNVSNETQLIHFDTNGFAISAGSACSSGRIGLSTTQMNMGYSEEIARTAIRISLGIGNTKQQIDKFVSCWRELYEKTNMKLAA